MVVARAGAIGVRQCAPLVICLFRRGRPTLVSMPHLTKTAVLPLEWTSPEAVALIQVSHAVHAKSHSVLSLLPQLHLHRQRSRWVWCLPRPNDLPGPSPPSATHSCPSLAPGLYLLPLVCLPLLGGIPILRRARARFSFAAPRGNRRCYQ